MHVFYAPDIAVNPELPEEEDWTFACECCVVRWVDENK